MASYATYRHIELDKVGYSKKRIRNPSSEIFKVLCPVQSSDNHPSSASSIRSKNVRNTFRNRDSFERLFGGTVSSNNKKVPPRKVQDFGHRNPVTGDGVACWDSKVNTPKIYKERNPVTGEFYYISSPATTPTKPIHLTNGIKSIPNGILEAVAGTNGTVNENSS